MNIIKARSQNRVANEDYKYVDTTLSRELKEIDLKEIDITNIIRRLK